MNNLVIKFTDKIHPTESTSELQVDQSIDVDGLSNLLNAINSKTSEYFFFYKNQRIHENIARLVEKHSLNVEEVLNIEFIDTMDIKADHLTEYDDTIISLAIKDNEVFYLTYAGDVYHYKDNKKMNNTKVIRLVSSDEMLLGASKEYVVDLENGTMIYESAEEIRSVGAYKKHIVIAHTDKIILMADGNTTEIHSGDDLQVREVKINNKMISWTQKHNTVGIYDFETKKVNLVVSKCCINRMRLIDEKLVFTTGDSTILVVDNLECIYFDTLYRLTKCLEKYKSYFFYSAQHDVVLTDISKLRDLLFLRVEGQINDILVMNDVLLIANDNFISEFKINNHD